MPPHDLAASTVGADLLETPEAVAAGLAERPTPPTIGVRHLAHLPRLPHRSLTRPIFDAGHQRRDPAVSSLVRLL